MQAIQVFYAFKLIEKPTNMKIFLVRKRKFLHSVVESGAVAQLEERVVRNDKVVGSIPISSTIQNLMAL